MRSLLKYLSTRPKYCVPFRRAFALKLPLSMKLVEQGSSAVPTIILVWPAGHPLGPKKKVPAVFATVTLDRPAGVYVVSSPVPTVPGKLVVAKVVNAGSAKVTPPVLVELAERNGSTSKKKKNWWCGMIGPPMPKAMLLPWNGRN